MKTIIFLAVFILSGPLILFSQNEGTLRLSLYECIQTAVEKNINIAMAQIEREKVGYKISETRSTLFPQITVNGNFQDNLKLPTTILPGDLIGQPGTTLPVKMGVQYTTSVAANVNQLLYNQTALTALKLSKKADDLSRLGVEKASEELAHEVAKLYFMALTSSEQKLLVKENITRTQRMANIIKTLVSNGIGKKVDYDRICVTLENLRTQLSNTEALHEQQLNMIKYMLEIPIQQPIVLTDTVTMFLLHTEPVILSDFSDHIDIQILESQKDIAQLNRKIVYGGYYPSLSFTGQYAWTGMRNEFKHYFNSHPENKWFGSSYIGLNLSIPVFDGLEKRAKSRQAKLDYQQTELTLNNTKERFNVDYKNAMNNYYNNKNNVTRQKQNIDLAEKVYVETSLKYREGLASMSDLLQDEIGLSNAQASYLNALYNFKEAELQIMSLTGEIEQFYHKNISR